MDKRTKENLLYLNEQRKKISYDILDDCCEYVLISDKFPKWPGSSNKHHNYPGGLVNHTTEVMKFALAIAKEFDELVNWDVIITSVIFHDFAKIWDYNVLDTGKIVDTEYKNLVRHVAGSHAEFIRVYTNFAQLDYNYSAYPPIDIINKIEHCILAHHGIKDWGSPIEAGVITESRIIHYADMLSAKHGPTSEYWPE